MEGNVERQNPIRKYIEIYRFHSGHGKTEAFRRMLSIFRELDFFDFRHGTNTRTIKVKSLEKKTYMPYWPAFTSVVSEMIKFSHNYYISAIRYSDLNRKTVFVDFGAGLAKTPIMAALSGKFDVSGGLEIDRELVEEGGRNIERVKRAKKIKNLFLIQGNVENPDDIQNLVQVIKGYAVDAKASTIFIFNKNSYGPEVLGNSLTLIEKYFDSIVYLYQNPIHQYILTQRGYLEFGQDSAATTENKNYKYRLFFKHKYEN